MNEQEIAAIQQRAADTVNGFATPKMQLARDVLKLVAVLKVRDRQVARLAEAAPKTKVDDIFKGIF